MLVFDYPKQVFLLSFWEYIIAGTAPTSLFY